jgi:hypothetical protein
MTFSKQASRLVYRIALLRPVVKGNKNLNIPNRDWVKRMVYRFTTNRYEYIGIGIPIYPKPVCPIKIGHTGFVV